MQRLVGHSLLATTMRYHRKTDVSQQAALKAISALGLGLTEAEAAQQKSQHSGEGIKLRLVQAGL